MRVSKLQISKNLYFDIQNVALKVTIDHVARYQWSKVTEMWILDISRPCDFDDLFGSLKNFRTYRYDFLQIRYLEISYTKNGSCDRRTMGHRYLIYV